MRLRVAYIISQYPEFHETFVAREVEALRCKEIPPTIFSLKTPGPAERDIYPAHRELVRYSPFLVSASLVAANLAELLRAPGAYLGSLCWLIRTHLRQPVEMLKTLAAFPKTVLYARSMRGRFDALHAHWATVPAAMAVVVHRLTGIGFSITAHAWDIFLSPPGVLRRKIALAQGIVTCTGYNREYLISVCDPRDRGKIHRNYHGLDLAAFPGSFEHSSAEQPLRIIAIGRLVEQKGFLHLIRAVALLARKKLAVHLTIVGDGPLHHGLAAEAGLVPKPGTVEFAGRLPHAQTVARLLQSHVMAAPSVIAGDGDRDGIPNVILEAMACALPVVGSAVSGIPEVVQDAVTGYLIPPGDPEALAQALERIARDREGAARLGLSGRLLVERMFDVECNTDEFVALLQGFHQGGAGRARRLPAEKVPA